MKRVIAGTALAAVSLGALTAVLVPARDSLSLASVVLLYLVPVIAVAVVSTLWVSLISAIAANLLVNYFFVPPFHTLSVDHRDNVITLAVYLLVAAAISLAVELATNARASAVRRDMEAELLERAAKAGVDEQTPAGLLEQVRARYGMDAVALVEGDQVVTQVGTSSDERPALTVRAGEGMRLLAWGPQLFGEDRAALARLAAAAARTLQVQRLAGADRARTALLAAVGHDLRTPLAAITVAASTLRQSDLKLSAADRDELLETVTESAERLDDLVENLLAVSRLRAGMVSVHAAPTALDAVVGAALRQVPASRVHVEVPDGLALVQADPGLLERVVANLLSNALAASPNAPVTISAGVVGGAVALRVIDHGPGVPEADHEKIFEAFQRLDDHSAAGGLGLGLAIARGFTEAMGGRISPSTTPGGGLTMTVTLPIAAGAA